MKKLSLFLFLITSLVNAQNDASYDRIKVGEEILTCVKSGEMEIVTFYFDEDLFLFMTGIDGAIYKKNDDLIPRSEFIIAFAGLIKQQEKRTSKKVDLKDLSLKYKNFLQSLLE